MRVLHKETFEFVLEVDLENQLTSELQRTDYDTRGEAECAREVANRAAASLAKLVCALVEADRLTLAQAQEICGTHGTLEFVTNRSFVGS